MYFMNWEFLLIILALYLLSGPVLGLVGLRRAKLARSEIERLHDKLDRLKAAPADARPIATVFYATPEAAEASENGEEQPKAQEATSDTHAADETARVTLVHDAAAAQPDTLAPPPRPASGWEQNITSRWMLWLGAVTLALGGGFLVKVTIDAGLLTPAVRSLSGIALGLALAVGGEVLRRRPLQRAIATVAPNHLPPALSAAGIAILFASLYAAHGLYGLIGAPLAFALLALVAFAAVGLSLLQGRFVALLGLLGGFITPILVARHEPSALAHFGYLFALTGGALAAARYRRWNAIAALALSGAIAWALLWIAGAWRGGDTPVLALFLLVLAGAAVFFRHGLLAPGRESLPRAKGSVWRVLGDQDRLVSLSAAGIALAGFALLRLDHYGPLSLACLLLLAAFYLFSGRRVPQLQVLPAIAVVLCLGALASWHLPQFIAGPQPLVTLDGVPLGEVRSPILPPPLLSFATAAGLAAALFWSAGYGFLRGAGRPAYWAVLSAFMPLGILIVAYWRVAGFEVSLPWAALALGLAGIALLAAQRLLPALGSEPAGSAKLDAALAVYAVAVVSGVTLAMTMQLREAWLTVALSIQLPAIAWVAERTGVKALRASALVLAAVIVLRLVLNQTLISGTPVGAPLFNWLLYGYGLPALAFATAARQFRRGRDDALVVVLEAGALLFTVLLVSFEIRSFFNEGILGAKAYSLAEQACQTIAWLAMAYGLLRLQARHPRPVLLWGARTLGAIGAIHALLGPVGLSNPLLTGAPVGDWPIFNLLSLAYLAPAALALLYARTAERQGETFFAAAAASQGMFLILLDFSLEIRHAFHGSRLDLGPTGDLEWYAYSLGWLIFAGALLALGIATRRTALRYASLLLLLLSVGKVFLFDMAALTGLYRALSFLGLGASLLAIGYLYQRFVFPKAPSPTLVQDGDNGHLMENT